MVARSVSRVSLGSSVWLAAERVEEKSKGGAPAECGTSHPFESLEVSTDLGTG